MKLSPQEQFRKARAASRVGGRGFFSIRNSKIAFTLLELLVVIVIIGLLAAVGLPAIRGMTKSNAMAAANRQLLDDLSYARQRAIAEHTKVYMVFVPPPDNQFWARLYDPTIFTQGQLAVVSNLWAGQYTTYALISLRTVGDQPGVSTPRYLTGWRTLPAGVFIATNKFAPYIVTEPNEYKRAFPADTKVFFPIPMIATNKPISLAGMPYIGFDYLGQLISTNNQSEAIPLVRGSIFYARDATGALLPQAADLVETPPSTTPNYPTNVIHIDWLTGKARVERQEVQ